METIIKTAYPLGGIQTIKVFAPERSNTEALKFPVEIDGEAFVFYLNNDAVWDTDGKRTLPDDLRHFIADNIENLHL